MKQENASSRKPALRSEKGTFPIDKYASDADQRKPKQKNAKMQVLRLRPAIADNDYQRIISKATDFLSKRHPVRFQVMLRGRQNANPELGTELLNRVIQDLEEVGNAQRLPTTKNLTITLNPKKASQ